MRSDVKTVKEYIDALPPDRQEPIQVVRQVILDNLPSGYQETMNWGMITYEVPLELYPDTYNKKPLMVAALTSQKNYMAVYLSGIYSDEDSRIKFEEEYLATGRRFDAGKSCVRFRKLEDLPLPLIAKTIRSLPMANFIALARNVQANCNTFRNQ